MKNKLIIGTLMLGLSNIAYSDQATVDEIQKAGGILSLDEKNELTYTTCSATGCQALVDKVAQLVAKHTNNHGMVEAILMGASSAYPGYALNFSEEAMMESPELVGIIASVVAEIAPTAAGVSFISKEDCY